MNRVKGGLFIGLILIMFYWLFRGQNIGHMIDAMTKVNPIYMMIAIGCMGIFVGSEALNIKRSLRLYGYLVSWRQCLKYALVGFFFSSVTPSASGGQPMQLYYMHKDRIEVSHGMLALMMELVSYQFVTVIMVVLAFLVHFSFFNETLPAVKYVLMIGIGINVSILALLLMALFSKKWLLTLIRFISTFLRKLHFKKADQIEEKALSQCEMYQAGARVIKANKKTMIKILLTTCTQIIALHSIPFWIYKAFGLTGYSLGVVISIQAVLYITVSVVPLPGAVGASESGFMMLFSTLFPTQIIHSAMLLSRGVSFYLFVLISGLYIAFIHSRYKKDNQTVTNINFKNA